MNDPKEQEPPPVHPRTLAAQKDGSTPFGQGQRGNTGTQDEQDRMRAESAAPRPPHRQADARPSSKR